MSLDFVTFFLAYKLFVYSYMKAYHPFIVPFVNLQKNFILNKDYYYMSWKSEQLWRIQ